MANKILILGGAGFLGAHLVRRIACEPGAEITVLDSLDPRFQSSMDNLAGFKDRIRFIRGDIRDEKLLAEVVPENDIIFNLAAQSSHIFSLRDPIGCAEINVIGSLKLLEAVRLFNPEAVVVYTSSSTVCGKITQPVADENHPEKPLGIYSAHKGAAEKYYQIYASLHKLKTVVLRFANLYGLFGKVSPDFGFINYFIGLAIQGKPITVFGTGQQLRNVMYAEDAAEILVRAANCEKLYGKLFMATSPFHLTVIEIAETILRVFPQGHILRSEWPVERKMIEVEDAVFSSDRLRSITGWRAHYNFEEGLKKIKYLLETQKMELEILK